MNTPHLLSIVILISSAAACGEDEAVSYGLASGLDGRIYQMTTHNQNEAACESGGGSVLENGDNYLIAVTNDGPAPAIKVIPTLDLLSCASPSDCRELFADIEAGLGYTVEYRYTMEELDEDPLVGEGGSIGSADEDDLCSGRITATALALRDDGFSLIDTLTFARDFPAEADGSCSVVTMKESIEGLPCSIYTTLEAVYLEDL